MTTIIACTWATIAGTADECGRGAHFCPSVRGVVGEALPIEPEPLTIAQHNKPSGAWCRWSGSKTNRTDGVCPDRCAWTIPAADLTVKHIGRRIEAAVGTDEGVYQLDGLIVWITFTEDEVRIGVVEKPDSGANDWEFSHDDYITITDQAAVEVQPALGQATTTNAMN